MLKKLQRYPSLVGLIELKTIDTASTFSKTFQLLKQNVKLFLLYENDFDLIFPMHHTSEIFTQPFSSEEELFYH